MANDTKINELENLRTFMEESILRADPTADVSPGSNYDTEVITPLIKRLSPDPFDTPIREFILARLRSEYTDLVIQDGDPIDDYVVKIQQTVAEPFRRQIVRVSQNQSLQDPSVLTDDEADALGANFFVYRRTGKFSVGIGRLYFTAAQAVLVTPSNICGSVEGLRFIPVENQAIDSDSMRLNLEGSLYYFDIVVRAEKQGSEYDIAEGSLNSIDGLPSVVQVTNKNKFEEGADRESTEAYVARIRNSLAEKSLVTARGINSRLFDVFENIRTVAVIGFGDPEMQRDILKSEGYETYAFFAGNGTVSTDTLTINSSDFSDGDPTHAGFQDAGTAVGDVISYYDLTTHLEKDYTITEIVSNSEVKVSPVLAQTYTAARFVLKRNRAEISLSDIPGGILVPETPYGTITVPANEVHIGGMLDVFVRAGFPQERNTTLEAIRDGLPLHFGVDLETFGERDDILINVTPVKTPSAAWETGPGSEYITIYTFDYSEGMFWWPSEEDVGRYIQLIEIGGAPTKSYTFKIQSIDYRMMAGSYYVFMLTVDRSIDYTTGAAPSPTEPAPGYWDFRILESISVKDIVRDRDNTRPPAGVDYDALGVKVGDSVVIESGDDADIYSIRALLTSIDDNDSLLLSQELTKTVRPDGSGDGTGLRYRIADTLDVDLVGPRTTKIPLGNIFLGGDLSTIAGSNVVTATGTTDFAMAGVVENDTLEILEGDSAGKYNVISVSGATAIVNPAPPSTTFNVNFTVYTAFTPVERPLVRIRDIELLDSSLQATGINVPFGDAIDVRVLGQFSNRAQGILVESYNGTTAIGTTFTDSEATFQSHGILPGHRLVILNDFVGGEYTVKEVLSETSLQVYPTSEGGIEFESVRTDVHYYIGLPSTGFVRVYFLEPTSVNIDTGLLGGRLKYTEGDVNYEYRFSEVDGRYVFPASDQIATPQRDLRVAQYTRVGTSPSIFETVVEFTDVNTPNVFDMELQEGDYLEVFEQLWWRSSTASLMFDGPANPTIYAGFPALHTVAGSDLVTVGPSSHVDFTAMDILGQQLFIEAGPDEGEYIIEEVVGARTLRLNSPMKANTATIAAYDVSQTGTREVINVAGKAVLHDTVNPPGSGGAKVGDFITIYEVFSSSHYDKAGTWEIESITDPYNVVLKDCPVTGLPLTTGNFLWYRTTSDTNVEHLCHIYKQVPKQFRIKQIGTKDTSVDYSGLADIVAGGGGDINVLVGSVGQFSGVKVGSLLEIVYSPSGVNFGSRIVTYVSPAEDELHTATTMPFSAIEAGVKYRVWGGIHGSTRMVTLEKTGAGDDGKLEYGVMMPYRILRPKEFRISSTQMADNFDGSFYYFDIQVESMGSGDALNLAEETRLVVTSGLEAGGYTYSVENNTLTFSPYEQVSLRFDKRFLPIGNSDLPENFTEINGRNLQINYDMSATARVVDDLLHSETERPVNANPIARHFLPSYVYTTLNYMGGSSAALVGQEVEDYINGLGGDELDVSAITRLILRRGATTIQSPISLAAVTHDLDRKLIVDRTKNAFGVGEVPYNGSARITSFFAYLNEGLNVVRG